jgi:hypothetical protein
VVVVGVVVASITLRIQRFSLETVASEGCVVEEISFSYVDSGFWIRAGRSNMSASCSPLL